MQRSVRRVLAAGGATLGVFLGSVFAAPAAEAQALPLEFDVTATVFIKKLGIENTVEGGTFVGEIDLATGALVADLDLPASETMLELGPLPLASAGFATEPTGPTTGTVDLQNLTVETRSEFHIRITHLRPLGLRAFNLVGNNCRTAQPVVVESAGDLDLSGGIEFEAEFEIPRFRNCGLLVTPILNQLIPGPGNTFSATLE